jgi:hypothetical protein
MEIKNWRCVQFGPFLSVSRHLLSALKQRRTSSKKPQVMYNISSLDQRDAWQKDIYSCNIN